MSSSAILPPHICAAIKKRFPHAKDAIDSLNLKISPDQLYKTLRGPYSRRCVEHVKTAYTIYMNRKFSDVELQSIVSECAKRLGQSTQKTFDIETLKRELYLWLDEEKPRIDFQEAIIAEENLQREKNARKEQSDKHNNVVLIRALNEALQLTNASIENRKQFIHIFASEKLMFPFSWEEKQDGKNAQNYFRNLILDFIAEHEDEMNIER